MSDPIALLTSSIQSVSENTVVQGFLVACIGFALTVLGALHALAGARIGNAIIPYGMGFAAGIMISASFTSLLIPSAEAGGIIPTAVGFFLGALAIHAIDSLIPHEHLIKGFEGPERLKRKLRTAWLLALAMIIHNVPEGAAVGATVSKSLESGVVLAIAIGIQNVPEGLAVALPMLSAGRGLKTAMGLAVVSGAVEPIAAMCAVALASVFGWLLPYMLSFAAGAMIYVVSHEIIPETHEQRREVKATIGLLIGLMTMFVLDAVYG